MSHAAELAKTAEPPVIWYQDQRVLRTALQATVTAVPALAAVLAILAAQWPAPWLVAVSAAAVAVQAVLAKVMAHPLVNAWLTRYTWFGSEPKR